MATTSLYRATDGSTTTTFTWSGWVKRSRLGVAQGLCYNQKDDSVTNQRWRLQFTGSDTLNFENKNSAGEDDVYLDTNQKFRDTSAWYHIVLVYDTTQAETDRVKIYINGESVEDNGGWGVTNRASADFTTNWSSGWEHYIGKMVDDSAANYFFDGVMAHVHCTYGTAYQASAFGETDATSGIWVAKTSPSVTYGSQGYFLKFASGASTTDSSGEGNTMTQAGTMTTTKDTPDNNFATWNPLYKSDYAGQNAPIYGNTGWISAETSTNYPTYCSTLGVTTGKWYFETYIQADSESTSGLTMGIADGSKQSTYLGDLDTDYVYYGNTGVTFNGGTGTAYGATLAVGDILGCAVDLDNLKIYWSKNGVWQNSGDPTSGATGTGSAYTMTAPSLTNTGVYMLATGDSGNANTPTCYTNFGNGYFGTTAVTSAEADGNGEGQFEYAPPTGYFALCTNNLGSES